MRIVRHIVDAEHGMEIMDVEDCHGRKAQFQCGILSGPEPATYFEGCLREFSEQEQTLTEHKKNFKPRTLLAMLLFLLLAPFAKAAPTVTVSASAVTLLGTSQSISITCTLIDPYNTGMLKVSGTGIVPVTRTSTVTPGTTATVGPIYGNDAVLNAFGVNNVTYYLVQVFTVTGGFISSTPALQNFYAFTGSGTIDLSTATPLVPNFMNSTAGVSIPGNFSVSGTFTASAGGSLTGTFSGNPAFSGNPSFSGAPTFSSLSASNLLFPETTAPSTASAIETCYGDSTAHTLKCAYGIAAFFTETQTVGSGTAAMTTGLINSGACGTTVTVSAIGVISTDAIAWSFNAAPAANPAELVISSWPTSNNVNFQYCNPTAGGVTPNGATLNWRVLR